MSTVQSAISTMEASIARDKALATEFRDAARRENRSMTSTEKTTLTSLEAHLERQKRSLDQLYTLRDDERAVDASMNEPGVPTAASRQLGGRRTASVSVSHEPRTYSRHNDPHGVNFLQDVVAGQLRNDPNANERLVRHNREERVERPGIQVRAAGDSTTANWTGLVVPQYLTDLVANQISPLRPFADLVCVKRDLPPDGMSVNFSRVTTGSSVTLQSAELGTIGAASIDDSLSTLPVQTFAGMVNLSRQAVDRGTGIEETTFLDLSRKYAAQLDSTLLNQATTGVSAIAQNVAYVSASPTGAEMWPFIEQADSKLEAALQGVAFPTHVVMHSRRWHWLASQVGTSFPFVGSVGVNSMQGAMLQPAGDASSPSVRAKLSSGLLVVVDNNISTTTSGTQDEIYVAASGESMYLFEDPAAPVFIRAEQVNAPTLGVLLVLYGYAAYGTRYANSVSKITGTGLVAPAGF